MQKKGIYDIGIQRPVDRRDIMDMESHDDDKYKGHMPPLNMPLSKL